MNAQSYGHLKALLIVGSQEDGTQSSMEGMDDIADLFKEHGIQVYRFYDQQADWEAITRVAPECSFLVYDGHGSTMGDGGKAGGLCINTMVSSSRIRESLRLHAHALVMFQSVCYGAGSSASDDDDIGILEAKDRVSNYAQTFLDVGADGYYANNYVGGVYFFLQDFLEGISLKEAYQQSVHSYSHIEFEDISKGQPRSYFSIASSPGGGYATRTTYTNGVKKVEQIPSVKDYDIACMGTLDLDVRDLK
ncbi:MAG: hypothetical protein ACKO6L_04145 [Flavobacteriales bacterium]